MKTKSIRTPGWIHLVRALVAGIAPAAVFAAESTGKSPALLSREKDLVQVTLEPEAERALRLKVLPVEKRVVATSRLFGGEIVTPLAPEGRGVGPMLGGTLEEVLRIAELQSAADGRIVQAQVQMDGARIALERAQKMLSAEAGSVRAVDEARISLGSAEAALSTARAQRALLGVPVGGAGAARSWVRVAIFSVETASLDAKAPALVRPLGPGSISHGAQPVAGPSTANHATGTVDWYYEITEKRGYRAGERVAVEIAQKQSSEQALVIPFRAVLCDIHGGQWVYARTAERTYARRRVQVARIVGEDAVLASGPAAGTEIVTDGCTELFGVEFVTGK